VRKTETMLPGSTSGPGPWGPSPAFGRIPHNGIHVAPAQTRPRPGVYSGPSVVSHLPWPWFTLLAIALIVAAVVASRLLRRR
jgi:hypothetical protein